MVDLVVAFADLARVAFVVAAAVVVLVVAEAVVVVVAAAAAAAAAGTMRTPVVVAAMPRRATPAARTARNWHTGSTEPCPAPVLRSRTHQSNWPSWSHMEHSSRPS